MPAALPCRRYTATILRRGAGLWLGVRLAVILLGGGGGAGEAAAAGSVARLTLELLAMSPAFSVAVVLVVGGLALLDSGRRREHTFLMNLGFAPPVVVPAIAALAAALLELSVQTAARAALSMAAGG